MVPKTLDGIESTADTLQLMTQEAQILRDTDPRCLELEALGYTLIGESWGARLTVDGDRERFSAAIVKANSIGIDVREIGIELAEEVLQLETTNNPDYPRTPANMRLLPTIKIIRELWATHNRIFGALSGGVLVGVLATSPRGTLVELDFASILPDHRGKGIGRALAAAAIVDWMGEGVHLFGTGGAAINEASLGTVTSLGFSIEERWRSYQPPL